MTEYTPSQHVRLARTFPDSGFGGGDNNGFNKLIILLLIILLISIVF